MLTISWLYQSLSASTQAEFGYTVWTTAFADGRISSKNLTEYHIMVEILNNFMPQFMVPQAAKQVTQRKDGSVDLARSLHMEVGFEVSVGALGPIWHCSATEPH